MSGTEKDILTRLDAIEATLRSYASEGDPAMPHALKKDLDALSYRIEKLELDTARLGGRWARYQGQRQAADNTLMAEIKSVRFEARELAERVAAVELAGFPSARGAIERLIGKASSETDNPLDKKPRGRRPS